MIGKQRHFCKGTHILAAGTALSRRPSSLVTDQINGGIQLYS